MKFSANALTAFIVVVGSTSGFTKYTTTITKYNDKFQYDSAEKCHYSRCSHGKIRPRFMISSRTEEEEDFIVDSFGRIQVVVAPNKFRGWSAIINNEEEEEQEEEADFNYNYSNTQSQEKEEEEEETKFNYNYLSNYKIQTLQDDDKEEVEEGTTIMKQKQSESNGRDIDYQSSLLLAKMKEELKFKTKELEISQSLLKDERRLRLDLESNLMKEYKYIISVLKEQLQDEIQTSQNERKKLQKLLEEIIENNNNNIESSSNFIQQFADTTTTTTTNDVRLNPPPKTTMYDENQEEENNNNNQFLTMETIQFLLENSKGQLQNESQQRRNDIKKDELVQKIQSFSFSQSQLINNDSDFSI